MDQSRNSEDQLKISENIAVEAVADRDELRPNGVRFQLKVMWGKVTEEAEPPPKLVLARRFKVVAAGLAKPVLTPVKPSACQNVLFMFSLGMN